MGNNQKPPRSFNTIRRSQTKERAKRSQLSRVVLLAILGIIALILISLLILGICSIVDAVSDTRQEPSAPNQPTFPSNARYDDAYFPDSKDLYKGSLILVNGQHPYQLFDAGNNYQLSTDDVTLVNMSSKDHNGKLPYLAASGAKMEETAYDHFNEMMLAFLKETGNDTVQVNATNAYRSYADQSNSIYSTPAGYSDHHTGYCVALTTRSATTTGIDYTNYQWLFDNAHRYGFIQRYPSDKSNETGVKKYEYCFRYVGVAHATYMKENDLCMEEYLDLLKSTHTINNALRFAGADNNQYEVYYVAATNTSFPIPSNYQHTVSGNNVDGFIVTVNLSAPKA